MEQTKGQYELFSKTKVQNKTQNASHTFTALNLKRPTCACVLTFAEFPSKEHDLNVPEPPPIDTAPPCELIFLS